MTDHLLRNVAMFEKLSDEALAEVEAALGTRKLAAGEVLFNQGDPGDELIIVQEGKLAIYVPDDGKPAAGQPIRLFGPGGLLGEMVLVDQKPRSLSARAEEASVILTLHRDAFHHLVSESPQFSLALMANLSGRVRYTTDFLSEVREWVQHMSEGNYQAGMKTEAANKYSDPSLATLAAEFAQMAAKVKEREDTLRQEVAVLRIEIDEAKRKEESSQIMGSEYFRNLRAKVKELKRKDEE
jgi:CRP-like cAMP-binding protein